MEERHRHYYSPPRLRQHRQPWRLQVQAERPVVQHIYKGTADCLKNIAAEEGVAAGLYKGFVANALRSVGCALVLVLYDRAKTYLCSSTGAVSAIIMQASFIAP